MTNNHVGAVLVATGLILSACGGAPVFAPISTTQSAQTPLAAAAALGTSEPTPLPTRPNFKPGELVDYTAQTGDTVPALAARFNTTVSEIMQANPLIPTDATTMPPGLPMKIPIYFRSLWGSPLQIIPDSAFVNGPAQIGFNTSAYVTTQPGWLEGYWTYAAGRNRTGAEIVDYIAANWSISPRLLLAILEYKAGALSQPRQPP